MAHYALLDEDNFVIQIITGVDENIIQTDMDGTKVGGSSKAWEEFYASRPWFNAASCKRTSYNGNIRKQYAGIGYKYDPVYDVFIQPQPFPSWSLDENFDWVAPVPYPSSGFYNWDESNLNWIPAELPAI